MDSSIVHINFQPPENSYCSKRQKYLNPSTTKSGLRVVEKILRQAKLCFHDVEMINAIYTAVNLAERDKQGQTISREILEKANAEIRQTTEENLTSNRLISFYHLEGFLREKTADADAEKDRLNSLKQNLPIKKIAKSLSFCCSEEQFAKEVRFFNVECEETEKTLSSKRKKFKLFNEKREKLKKLQLKFPNFYPHYFNELLELGHFTLYDHMIKIEEVFTRGANCAEEIKAIEDATGCITFVNIILETIAIIKQSVLESLAYQDTLPKKKVFFLLGNTKAGKSTTLCFLRGDKMYYENFGYSSKSDKEKIIGKNVWNSCTFLPFVQVVNDLVLIDFPGFEGTHGSFISLGVKLALHELVKNLSLNHSDNSVDKNPDNSVDNSPKILLLTPFSTEEAGNALITLKENTNALFENISACSLFGLTKYTKNEIFKDLEFKCKLLESKENFLKKKQGKAAKKVEELKKRIEKVENKVKKLEDEIRGLEDRQNEEQIEEKRNGLRRLQEKLNELQKQSKSKGDGSQTDSEKQLEEEIQQLKEDIPKLEERISELEKDILKQMGRLTEENAKTYDKSGHVVFDKLDSLEEFEYLEKLIKGASQLNPPKMHENIQLNAAERALLDAQFKEKLKGELRERLPEKLDKEEIVKKGLVPALLGDKFEIFFQKFDPSLQFEYDKAILEEVFKIYITKIIRTIRETKQIVEEIKNEELKGKIELLEEDAITIGVEYKTSQEQDEELQEQVQRDTFQQEIECLAQQKATDFEDSILQGFLRAIGFATSAEFLKRSGIESISKKEIIENYFEKINYFYSILDELGEIRLRVEKNKQLIELCTKALSYTSDEEFFCSVKNKIAKVRKLYGENEWDSSIKILKRRICDLLKNKKFVKGAQNRTSSVWYSLRKRFFRPNIKKMLIASLADKHKKMESVDAPKETESVCTPNEGTIIPRQQSIEGKILQSKSFVNVLFAEMVGDDCETTGEQYWRETERISKHLKLNLNSPLQRLMLASLILPKTSE